MFRSPSLAYPGTGEEPDLKRQPSFVKRSEAVKFQQSVSGLVGLISSVENTEILSHDLKFSTPHLQLTTQSSALTSHSSLLIGPAPCSPFS